MQKQKGNAQNTSMKEIFVKKAHYLNDYKVQIIFNDKKKKVIDFGEFLQTHRHSVFNKYKRIENFKKLKIDERNIVWGENWDLIFPIDQLYAGKMM